MPPSAPPAVSGVAGLAAPDPNLLRQAGLPPIAPNPNIGTTQRGEYDLLGRRIPLPAGDFEVIAYLKVQVATTEGVSAALAQFRGNRLSALVVVFATPADRKLGVGFRATRDCLRTDVYVEVTANEEFGPQDCMIVNHIWPDGFRAPDASNILKAVTTALDTRGVPLPPALIISVFNLADRDGYQRIWIYFNPEVQGIESRRTAAWNESDWHSNYIARDPNKLAYLDSVRQWAHNWRPYMRQSFDGTLKTLPPVQLAGTFTSAH